MAFLGGLGEKVAWWFVEKGLSRLSLPLPLSARNPHQDFNTVAAEFEHLLDGQEKGLVNIDSRYHEAVRGIALSNLCFLSRGILHESPPYSIFSNIWRFDKKDHCLFMVMASGYQSVSSMAPWQIPENVDRVEHSEGVCIRAFCLGREICIPDMSGELQRKGEPIQSMLAIPLASYKEARDGELVIINVVASSGSYIADQLTAEQELRLKRVKELAQKVKEKLDG